MLRVALRGIAARRMRTFNTALAIALGVMLIAGTYVLTDTINSSFGKIFEQGAKGTDVAVVPKTIVKDDNGNGPPPLDARILEQVQGADGVQKSSARTGSASASVARRTSSSPPTRSRSRCSTTAPVARRPPATRRRSTS
jgi:putative ABC transport system permease protein